MCLCVVKSFKVYHTMGGNVCKSIPFANNSLTSSCNDINSLNADFILKRKLKRNAKSNSKLSPIRKRAQVQPITERIVEHQNISFLDHTKSAITLLDPLDKSGGFVEKLSCSFCVNNKDNVLKNKNQILNHHQYEILSPPSARIPSDVRIDSSMLVRPPPPAPVISDKESQPLVNNNIVITPEPEIISDLKNTSSPPLPIDPPILNRKFSIIKMEPESFSKVILEPENETLSTNSSSASISTAIENHKDIEPFPVLSEEELNERETGSITPILYRSVSTIPILEEDESFNPKQSIEEETDDNCLPTIINNIIIPVNEIPKRSLNRVESKLNLLLYNWDDINVDRNRMKNSFADDDNNSDNSFQELNSQETCKFCAYVNSTKDTKIENWTDLDKDVSMLMKMADKLSEMIVEKEKSNLLKKLSKDSKDEDEPETGKSIEVTKKDNLDQSEQAQPQTDDYVEEKKVSFSYLERINSKDLKEKVQLLRRRRISVTKTSAGKCMMDFSDGNNTYQVQSKWNGIFLNLSN